MFLRSGGVPVYISAGADSATASVRMYAATTTSNDRISSLGYATPAEYAARAA